MCNFKSKLCVGLILGLVSAPAFAKGSDGSVLFGILIALGIVYLIFQSAVKARVEQRINQLKSEIELKEQQERLITKENAEKHQFEIIATADRERTKSAEHNEKLVSRLKKQQDDLTKATQAFQTSYIHGRKWLAAFIAEAFRAPDEAAVQILKTKQHPAIKAAEQVKNIAIEKKELMQRVKELEYILKTYHEYYPVLEEYSTDILNETATLTLQDDKSDADQVSYFISREEYEKLSIVERNQRALNNWKARKKSNVEIGRLYERYIGYKYEDDGWDVTYFGAIQGLEDMGRDLICRKGNALHIVQAKYWSKHKTIHEKHIFQLYGTTILLPLSKPELGNLRVTPVFSTTTSLSETALYAAKHLNIVVKSLDMDHNYPMIKCNVSGNNKIYHLPFDQQYDRVRIDLARGEGYVRTTAEAEEYGFRRAMRHANYSS